MQQGRRGDHELEAGINGEGRWGGKRKEGGKEKMRAPRRNSWDIPAFMKQRAKNKRT